jgi:hypothetical protein
VLRSKKGRNQVFNNWGQFNPSKPNSIVLRVHRFAGLSKSPRLRFSVDVCFGVLEFSSYTENQYNPRSGSRL